ncbi:hypothetical protein NBRGN_085_00030 [Nocardia brasiliensis NBRC 14402]|uniref:hypothetical protein n=1 Tax=Nocardia brasiliensis TaxID=37326 RepID=UPI00030DD890|nr:hypothetical protein [Nocardia brasiliensis]ASF10799.1 hypothetical protein CEQ30_29555 [Nocardia brasiliensis]GAJ85158.1 hypothetical protein NBRGN_085_00030 [Nocardia brasiliensis NBRC 14402]SUB10587.1 Uncharacterised protein [Nocardia brasiliensis]
MATRSVPQPPFSPELLADLHAGSLAPELHEQLWPAVRRDGEALRFVHALDEVSADLRALGRSEHVIHRMPDDVTARLMAFVDELDSAEAPDDTAPDDAGATIYQLPVSGEKGDATAVSDHSVVAGNLLAAEPEPAVPAAPPAAPVSLDERRRSRLRWLTAAAAAIAVVACASIALTVVRGSDDTPPIAQPTSAGTEFDELTAAAMLTALGRNDATGALSNAAARERCVHANGLDRTVLGSMNIRYHGQDAVLLLLTGPRTPKITALIVGTGCSTADPQHLTVQDIG